MVALKWTFLPEYQYSHSKRGIKERSCGITNKNSLALLPAEDQINVALLSGLTAKCDIQFMLI